MKTIFKADMLHAVPFLSGKDLNINNSYTKLPFLLYLFILTLMSMIMQHLIDDLKQAGLSVPVKMLHCVLYVWILKVLCSIIIYSL